MRASITGSVCLGVCALLGMGRLAPAASDRPNVLLVMTDDQGYGDVASHGNPSSRTPVQDALAASGARFERFYVSPVCAPTRASLLTGRYHLRTGVHGVTRGYENMRSGEITLAEVLKDAGYATGCFGKWHNGRHLPVHPNGQGFDDFVGFCGGHWNTYFDPPLEHNLRPIRREGYIADVITTEALQFMESAGAQPWLCYVAYNTPHSPWRVPDDYWDHYTGQGLDTKAHCAYAMVENIDDNLGRLLEFLDTNQLATQTIVLFLTDNGANSDRYNAGMKGRKGSVDEGGTRVPLFVRYPNVIAPGTIVQPIAFHLDVLPTLAEFCHVELGSSHRQSLDGMSVVPLLTSSRPPSDWPQRIYFTENYRNKIPISNLKAGVRTDRWRAVLGRGQWQLYDMHRDPGQKRDIAPEHPNVVQRLARAFDDWFAEMDPDALGYPAIPVGHPGTSEYVLPANEAMLVPGYGKEIQYTGDTPSGFANSWITHWTSSDAWPEWTIDVSAEGDYGVAIEYCCRPENIGCEVSVRIDGEPVVTQPVLKGHHPPLAKKPDRIFSHNYQDKQSWQRLDLGRAHLSEGEHRVSVTVRSIQGAQTIELKSLRFESDH